MRRHILLLSLLAVSLLPATAAEPVRVACVGNSITYGMTLQNRERDSYPAQLQRLLGEGYLVENFGHNGATLLRHGHNPYFRLPEFQQAKAFKGDIVVIHLGTNDTDPRNWPNYRDEFVSDYLALMDSLRSANPRARFLIARLAPITARHRRFQSGTHQWEGEVTQAIEEVARTSGAELIDFHAPLYPFPWMIPDALHPTPEGAGLLARTVYAGITGDYGGLRLPETFSDNMVLQRRKPLTLRGTANAGERVTLTLGRPTARRPLCSASATANNRGEWSIALPALEADTALRLTVEAPSGKYVYNNVAVGEVWLCSGQSNMAFPLSSARPGPPASEALADPQLRLFDMQPRWHTGAYSWSASACDSVNHLLYYRPATWQPCADNALGFSAVAYWFGRALRDSLQVPVGLICNAVGGSTAESWIDRDALETNLPKIFEDWLHNDFIQDWCRQRAAQNMANDSAKVFRHPYEPCYLYEAGILPLQAYPINGVIWYQGESNAHNKDAHARLFPLLVESWRRTWADEALPFHFVQLSSLSRPSWPWFRDAQRLLAEQVPHTGMVVTTDVGDSLDVHPTNKRAVGERLARLALVQDYGYDLLPAGPMISAMELTDRGRALRLSFTNARGLHTGDGLPPRTFEVAPADGPFRPATARIVGDAVVVSSPDVKQPRRVRYAWQPFTRANLVNADGLPASTFRLDADAQQPAQP